MKTKKAKALKWTLKIHSFNDHSGYAPARDAQIIDQNGDFVMTIQGRMDDEKGNQNLKLIAALPQLLKLAEERFLDLGRLGGNMPGVNSSYRAQWLKARAVLKKAQGGR